MAVSILFCVLQLTPRTLLYWKVCTRNAFHERASKQAIMQCLLFHTAGMSAVSHSRNICCATQRTRLLCHTADMSAVLHSRHVCCDAADISALSHSRHVCCVTQQTCLLFDTTDMSAM